mgnify:CR=1 FL=1
MNGPLDITPDGLAREALEIQQKLSAGLRTLPEVDDVHFGASHKQEVWRDGKTVLYRFVGEKAPTAKVPLLIVYALVNRPYMVDLQDDRSLVKGLLARGEDMRGTIVRGIDPQAEPTVSDIGGNMRSGRLTDLAAGEFGIVIGGVLADQLGLLPGDKLAMIAPEGTVSPAGIVPRLKYVDSLSEIERTGEHRWKVVESIATKSNDFWRV